MSYITKVLIAVDQLANALLNGDPDETLSASAYRQSLKGRKWQMRIINTLFFWQTDHCFKAFLSEKERKHLCDDYK